MVITQSSISPAPPAGGDADAVPRAELAEWVLSGPGLRLDWLAGLDRASLLEDLLADDALGRTDPMLLTEPVEGPRLILLAGRSWKVNWIDWKRQRCFVEPAEGGGKAFWLNSGLTGASFALTRAVREVLLGADQAVLLTDRARRVLAEERDDERSTVHPAGTVIVRDGDDVRWWTWAGFKANATLAATLSE
jgi:ATP-dependent Lhr-like helicase